MPDASVPRALEEFAVELRQLGLDPIAMDGRFIIAAVGIPHASTAYKQALGKRLRHAVAQLRMLDRTDPLPLDLEDAAQETAHA